MLFKALIVSALAAAGLVAAEEQKRPRASCNPTEKQINSRVSTSSAEKDFICTKELEGIVYQPETPTLNYFNRISEEIKCAGPVLWTPYNVSFIETFATKYGVEVQIFDAFRNLIYPEYAPIGKSTNEVQTAELPKTFYSTTSTANMNGSGFVIIPAHQTEEEKMLYSEIPLDISSGVAMYEFIVYNLYGELKYVNLILALSNAPIIKK